VILATDGTAYAWAIGLDQGGTGIAWWSPGSGVVRVIAKGRPSDTSFQTGTTVVDTRSGAATYLRELVAHADGGTIALNLRGPGKSESIAGVVRVDALPPLSC